MMIYDTDDGTEPMSSLAVARLLNGSPGNSSGVFRIPAGCHGERSVDIGLQGDAIVYQHPTGVGIGIRCGRCQKVVAADALVDAVNEGLGRMPDIQDVELAARFLTCRLAGDRHGCTLLDISFKGAWAISRLP